MDKDKLNKINLAIKGDKNALLELLKEEEKEIYTTLFYLKKNSQDINDLAQEILFKVSKKISQLKNPEHFKNWLNQIIINS